MFDVEFGEDSDGGWDRNFLDDESVLKFFVFNYIDSKEKDNLEEEVVNSDFGEENIFEKEKNYWRWEFRKKVIELNL